MGELRYQPCLRNGIDATDDDTRSMRDGLVGPYRVGDRLQPGMRAFKHHLARICQGDPVVESNEQLLAKKRLQPAYMLANGRGCHARFPGGSDVTACPRGGFESPQRCERRQRQSYKADPLIIRTAKITGHALPGW